MTDRTNWELEAQIKARMADRDLDGARALMESGQPDPNVTLSAVRPLWWVTVSRSNAQCRPEPTNITDVPADRDHGAACGREQWPAIPVAALDLDALVAGVLEAGTDPQAVRAALTAGLGLSA